jgi:hypothetical protein
VILAHLTYEVYDVFDMLGGFIFVAIKTVQTTADIMLDSVLKFIYVVLGNRLLKGADHSSPFLLLGLEESLVCSGDGR